MVVFETLTKITCSLPDVSDALALSDAAGWNQTADDWRLFVRHGRTIGYRDSRSALVATAAALPYDGGKGWISMVLVATPWRHQGVATQLLGECVKYLQQLSAIPLLDATPAGVSAYRNAGFEAGFELARWEGEVTPSQASLPDTLRGANGGDLQQLVALDRVVNGVDRRFLLEDFLSRDLSRAWLARDGSGFVITRQGRRATQIGPLVAADETSALSLLNAALGSTRGRVFLDLPDHWTLLAKLLGQRGFARQRPFARMALGPASVACPNQRLFLLAGPEFG